MALWFSENNKKPRNQSIDYQLPNIFEKKARREPFWGCPKVPSRFQLQKISWHLGLSKMQQSVFSRKI
jgi:hypothetical protein